MFESKEEIISAEKVQPQEDKYPRDELMANAMTIFGVMPEVVAGALHGNAAEELTVAEVQDAINNFLIRSVR
ncbi:hypothetical protein Dtox_4240 [Desulfofarcimen acetoxidans DSM 771]|uniref:YqzN/YkzM domain-containing protein n=1 Tax=Desulfofarcimen acetoxidans (strain ATCC 49208 / DSM 771 / KCTC 5769 / VKM B-1644 / 5575) TaxID=485916 RepID=C8VZG2_DESAS|nr:hypothetical protein [Desulfofarcimen acetoxidans]ACV64907.1 hypothetical protein Dtox_4240 [Desulfofarcimen acetoxidans DSM 771]